MGSHVRLRCSAPETAVSETECCSQVCSVSAVPLCCSAQMVISTLVALFKCRTGSHTNTVLLPHEQYSQSCSNQLQQRCKQYYDCLGITSLTVVRMCSDAPPCVSLPSEKQSLSRNKEMHTMPRRITTKHTTTTQKP